MEKTIDVVTTEIKLERDIGRGFNMKELSPTKAIDRVMDYCIADGYYQNRSYEHTKQGIGIIDFIKNAIINDSSIDYMFEIVTMLDVFGAMFGRNRITYDVCKDLADKLNTEASKNCYLNISILDLFNTNSNIIDENFTNGNCIIISIYEDSENYDRYLTMFSKDRVVTNSKNVKVDWMGTRFSSCHKRKFKLVTNTLIICPARAMLNPISKGDE